jgi:putative membrane protein insertion efficiency factor
MTKLLRLAAARIGRASAAGAIALIRLYQHTASPVLPLLLGPTCGCRFAPTCSHYAAEALQEHGLWAGAWLAMRRLVRCTPWHEGGIDPVPAKHPSISIARAARATHAPRVPRASRIPRPSRGPRSRQAA